MTRRVSLLRRHAVASTGELEQTWVDQAAARALLREADKLLRRAQDTRDIRAAMDLYDDVADWRRRMENHLR